MVALDYVVSSNDDLDIFFKDVLSTGDKTSLDGIVAAHAGVSDTSGESFLVRVQEQDDDPAKQVTGFYRGVGLTHTVPGVVGESFTDFTFPFNIAMLDMEFIAKSDNIGDVFSVCIAPETIVGAITADVSVNDTTFNVSPTVLENVKEGFAIHLSDGVNNDLCGFVTAGGIDKVAGTLSVSVGAEHAFAAATPTYVKMTVPVVQDVKFTGQSTIELGSSKIGGSFVPAGTNIRFHYDNKDGVAKEFHGILEILW